MSFHSWYLAQRVVCLFVEQVCFTCKLVKFSMFGQWGTRCKICNRNVCNNCLRKVNTFNCMYKKLSSSTNILLFTQFIRIELDGHFFWCISDEHSHRTLPEYSCSHIEPNTPQSRNPGSSQGLRKVTLQY